MSVLDTVANITQIAGVPLALLALGFAVIQIKKADQQLEKAGETARAQILLALDESLSTFEDIRQELNKKQPHITDDKKIALRRYIAAFERVGVRAEGWGDQHRLGYLFFRGSLQGSRRPYSSGQVCSGHCEEQRSVEVFLFPVERVETAGTTVRN
jgi:hypothetical protein